MTFTVLAFAGIAFALLQSLVAPALPEIQHEFGASETSAAWVMTAYLLSASVCTPILGRLGDMFGKERMLVLVLAALGAGSLLAAVAQDINTLIAARVIQGLGGAIFPIAFGIIRDEFPRDRVPHGIALMSALLGIGGGLGIVLAGPIVDTFSIHWLFWFPLGIVVLSMVAAILFVPESPVKSPGRVNWLGAGLLSGWLVALLVAISEGSTWGWTDPRTLGLFAVAIALAITWVSTENRSAEPLVDMQMMRIRGVWTVNLAAFLVGAGMYSSFVLLPQFVESDAGSYGFDASVTEAGLFMLPSTMMMLLISPVAGRMAARVGGRAPLAIGSALCCVAFLILAGAHDERWQIFVASGVLGAGIGLSFSSLANLIVEAVSPAQTGIATGMNTVMRTVGGSVGSQIGASVIAGTVVGSAAPTEGGFVAAFLICAVACAVGVLAALAAPTGEARQRVGAAAQPASG